LLLKALLCASKTNKNMEMHINWLAYAVAVIAQMVIGYLWFHPKVMGNKWAEANNSSIEAMKPKNSGLVYGLTLLFTLLCTMFILLNVTGFGQEDIQFHTIKHGVLHSIMFFVMVLIPVLATPALHEGRSANWYIVQLSYWLVRCTVAFAILSAWR
jgi:cobalamin biosynthesis protein CobD/CbiB